MSNCIRIVNEEVDFSSLEIDISEFTSLIQKASLLKTSDEVYNAEPQINSAWWYLVRNIRYSSEKEIRIRFGCGNSSHTWRDFRFLLNEVIKPLMKTPKYHTFLISDEADNYETNEILTVNFKSGM